MYLYAGLLKFLLSADAVNRRNDASVAIICLEVPGLVFLIGECNSPYFFLLLRLDKSYMGGILRVSFSNICFKGSDRSCEHIEVSC